MFRQAIWIIFILSMLLFQACYREVAAPGPFVPPVNVSTPDDTARLPDNGGMYYMLPKTRLDITIQVRKTDLIKGPFAAYADKYLGIDNVINANASFWQIDAIDIISTPVPDPQQLHYIRLPHPDSSSIPLSLKFNLNNIGLMTGMDNYQETRSVESTSISLPTNTYSSVFKYYADDNLFETVDTIVEKISVDSLTIEQTVYKTKLVEKTLEQKAKEAADFIQELKDQRIRLLTGYHEVPYDPATMQFMVGELEKMEHDYAELFTGITHQSFSVKSYSLIPEPKDDCTPVPIARFSYQDGLLNADNNKGEMIYLQVCSQGVNKEKECFRFNPADTTTSLPPTGFVYRVSEWTMVTVFLGTKVQKEIGMSMPQFGTTHRLPAFITRFLLDPETGAVKQVIYP